MIVFKRLFFLIHKFYDKLYYFINLLLIRNSHGFNELIFLLHFFRHNDSILIWNKNSLYKFGLSQNNNFFNRRNFSISSFKDFKIDRIENLEYVEINDKSMKDLKCFHTLIILNINYNYITYDILQSVLSNVNLKFIYLDDNAKVDTKFIDLIVNRFKFKLFIYNPFNRILLPKSNHGNLGTLYINDFDFVKKRIIMSHKYKIGELVF